jgi:hypothetical protein
LNRLAACTAATPVNAGEWACRTLGLSSSMTWSRRRRVSRMTETWFNTGTLVSSDLLACVR